MRVGLIGTAFGAKVHLPGFALVPGVDVVAICSAQRARADAAAEQFDVPFATDDYRELVQRDDVDLVDICTPADSHHAITLEALAAGKHVLCEKPLALDVDETTQMVDAAATAGTVNAVNHEMRYTPVRRHLRELVGDGYVGPLHFVNTTVFADYALNPSMEPYYHTWVATRANGGGLVNSLLSHHIDLLRFTFGELHDVSGTSATMITEKPVLAWDYRDGDPIGPNSETIGYRPADADDGAVIHGKLCGGAPFVLSGSWATRHGTGVRVEAYGRDGTLVLEPSGRLLGARTGEPLAELATPDSAQLRYPHDGSPLIPMFASLAEDVAAAISKERPPFGDEHLFATLDDGRLVQTVIDRVSPRANPAATIEADLTKS